jgi:hypothetical protein
MALFGNLFEKKYCVICNKELGIFGKTKIAEGHICKECTGKLSPYFHGYRSATADDIRAQLDYREANKARVAAFHVTRTLGSDTKVYVDEDSQRLIITNASPRAWADRNPDVFDLSQVTGCDYRVDETQTEIMRTNSEGEEVSYKPPRYDTDYDLYVTVYLNHPYASEIEFRVNQHTIEKEDSEEFRLARRQADEIKEALTETREARRAVQAMRKPTTCPNCLATTTPDENGCCEYCGAHIV